MVRDKLVLVTNRKSHTGFWLIPTSMTLKDLERVIALILCFFSPNSIVFLANYATMVEDRRIISAKYCFPVPVFHFSPKRIHPAARSLCDSWTCCFLGLIYAALQRSRHGTAVCLFVCLSCLSVWQTRVIVRKQKKRVPTFLYHMKEHSC